MSTRKRNTTRMRPFVVSYKGADVYGGKNWSGEATKAFVCILWNDNRIEEITNPFPLGNIDLLQTFMLESRESTPREVENLRSKYGKSTSSKTDSFNFNSEPPELELVPIEVYEREISRMGHRLR
jgi:hypothetical protein